MEGMTKLVSTDVDQTIDMGIEVIFNKQMKLERILKEEYAHWKIDNLTFAGNGLEQIVFKATTREYREVAIKVPWVRIFHRETEGPLDSRDILNQEFVLTKGISKYIHVSFPIHLHHGKEIDFLITKFVESDDSKVTQFEKGRFLSELHRIPIDSEIELIQQRKNPFITYLSNRLENRKNEIEKATGITLNFPTKNEIMELLAERKYTPSLLHMDYRNENLLINKGKINALIDWSNALVGDPALEVCRTSEFDGVDAEFLEGYGDSNYLKQIPKQVEYLYRLDAAIMLTNVFLTSHPNKENAQNWLNRVKDLQKKLLKEMN
ncbi:phosphotransferase [Rossellomorea vietnamensis]|uniref:phosphotransferase family protein n=1 Tax=Rossellomorea vietnamensis TaxID=218284 RepID=UPI001CCBE32A|nr:phosphotransferase [Rossellomorea vietnamensis]MCA0149693.1 phosphotransferase [Rossellomorea vietnamensis]